MILFRSIAPAIFLWAYLGSGTVNAELTTPAPIQVTIIAITDFDDDSLRDPLLISGIKEATKSLQEFFVRRYGIEPTVLSTKEETDADHLRTLLFRDLPLDSRKTVHIFFLLTHGFPFRNPDGSTNKSEIYLATSDTYADRYVGKAIRGAELLDAFRNMPSRSLALLFLDSCGSGAIDGDNLRSILSHEPEFASRLFLLASSQEKQDSYSARFSKALVNIWNQDPPPACYSRTPPPDCHCGRSQIESYLSTAIKKVPGVSGDADQTVRVVAPLAPLFCLEALGFADRLVFLVDASPEDLSVTVQPSKNADASSYIQVVKGIMTPVVLAPDLYTIIAKRSSGESQVLTVDLTNKQFAVQVLFSSDPLDQADAFAQSASILEARQNTAASEEARATAQQIIRTDEANEKERGKSIDAQIVTLQNSLSIEQVTAAGASNSLAQDEAEQRRKLKEARSKISGDCATCITMYPLDTLLDLNKAKERVAASRENYSSALHRETEVLNQLANQTQEKQRNTQRQLRREELERRYLSRDKDSGFGLFEVSLQRKITDYIRATSRQNGKAANLFDTVAVSGSDRGLVILLKNRTRFSEVYPLMASLTSELNARNNLLIEVELTAVTQGQHTRLNKLREEAGQIRQRLISLGITTDIVTRAEGVTTRTPNNELNKADSSLAIIISQKSELKWNGHPL